MSMTDLERELNREKDFCPHCAQKGHGLRECPELSKKTARMVQRMASKREAEKVFDRPHVVVAKAKTRVLVTADGKTIKVKRGVSRIA